MPYVDHITLAIQNQLQMERNARRYRKLRAALCAPQGDAVELSLEADTPDEFDAMVDQLPEVAA